VKVGKNAKSEMKIAGRFLLSGNSGLGTTNLKFLKADPKAAAIFASYRYGKI